MAWEVERESVRIGNKRVEVSYPVLVVEGHKSDGSFDEQAFLKDVKAMGIGMFAFYLNRGTRVKAMSDVCRQRDTVSLRK